MPRSAIFIPWRTFAAADNRHARLDILTSGPLRVTSAFTQINAYKADLVCIDEKKIIVSAYCFLLLCSRRPKIDNKVKCICRFNCSVTAEVTCLR